MTLYGVYNPFHKGTDYLLQAQYRDILRVRVTFLINQDIKNDAVSCTTSFTMYTTFPFFVCKTVCTLSETLVFTCGRWDLDKILFSQIPIERGFSARPF